MIVEIKTASNNKESESYPSVLSECSEDREKGNTNRNVSKTVENRKRKERRRDKDKKRFHKVIESRKQHILIF